MYMYIYIYLYIFNHLIYKARQHLEDSLQNQGSCGSFFLFNIQSKHSFDIHHREKNTARPSQPHICKYKTGTEDNRNNNTRE